MPKPKKPAAVDAALAAPAAAPPATFEEALRALDGLAARLSPVAERLAAHLADLVSMSPPTIFFLDCEPGSVTVENVAWPNDPPLPAFANWLAVHMSGRRPAADIIRVLGEALKQANSLRKPGLKSQIEKIMELKARGLSDGKIGKTLHIKGASVRQARRRQKVTKPPVVILATPAANKAEAGPTIK